MFYNMSQKLRKRTIFNINTHFMDRTTYDEFKSSATIIPQRNLTSDREIKSIYDNEKIRKTVQEVRSPMSYP
jgi:hypothetical protein